jgi:hypothetical protein
VLEYLESTRVRQRLGDPLELLNVHESDPASRKTYDT